MNLFMLTPYRAVFGCKDYLLARCEIVYTWAHDSWAACSAYCFDCLVDNYFDPRDQPTQGTVVFRFLYLRCSSSCYWLVNLLDYTIKTVLRLDRQFGETG